VLARLRQAMTGDENGLAAPSDAARVRALGQITHTLFALDEGYCRRGML